MAKDNDSLSLAEINELFSYISKMDKLAAAEPDYNDREKWESWNAKAVALNDEYHDIVAKTLMASYADWKDNPQTVTGILKHYLATSGKFNLQMYAEERTTPQLSAAVRDLMNAAYIPLLNGEITNFLFNLPTDQLIKDDITGAATYEKNGIRYEVEGYDESIGNLSPSPLKLWDAVTAYFTFNNPYGIKKGINPIVEIPLTEYAAARGRDFTPRNDTKAEKENAESKRREFIGDIERDLDNLAKFRATARIKRGRSAGEYDKIALISPDHSVVGDIIQVTIPPKTAKYLLNSYVMSYAPEIQGLNDSNPNLYRIARKMLLQNSIDNNAAAGTDNTLKVKTLVASTPHIPSLETLKARGQRNWKTKIKQPLETVFKRLKEAGFLIDWYYNDPRTYETYTPEQAAKLSDNTYYNLNVVFTIKDNPEKFDRRKKIEAKKQENLEK